jgi:hypothetical protein
MLVVKRIKKEIDGEYSVTWKVAEEEMSFLLTYAINSLLQEGLLNIEDIEEDEKQLELDFLKSSDIDEMGKA